ncbi:MAG: hypothetical protein WBE28_02585 [bacterium]
MPKEDVDLLKDLEKKLAKLEEVEKALAEKERALKTAEKELAGEQQLKSNVEKLTAEREKIQEEVYDLDDRKTGLMNLVSGLERDLAKRQEERNQKEDEYYSLKAKTEELKKEHH